MRDGFQKLLAGRVRVRRMIREDGRERDDPTVVEGLAGRMDDCMDAAPDGLYLLARYTACGFQYWRLCGNG
ncbi:MAG: hypothetical protein OXU75_02245 [Deltaproteobacteria bacterium]|nr:hypothetical protein [Deltaproteobacteria bacterium]